MRINRAQIEQAYRALRLEEFEVYFQEIERGINDVVNEDAYQGKAVRAMKSYLKEVHGMAAKSFLIVVMEIEAGMNRFLSDFRHVDESDDAILDGDYLTHIRGIVNDYHQNMGRESGDFHQQVRIASQVMELSNQGLDNAMKELDHELQQAIVVAEDANDMMCDLNDQHMQELESLNDHLATLERVLDHIDGVLAGGIGNFRPGSFANSPLGRSLFNHMLSSATTMARNGSTSAALEVLAIIGGFISTLPPLIRRIFESVKGRAIQCAFIGDPVNAATGNFIYDHIDMKIDGRYPLEFRRFYNSLDATMGTLGRNWTHSYDIRIREFEDGGITIIYGDSHQEYYDKPEKEDSNIFTSASSDFNVLKKLEDESYELEFVDGSKFQFTKEGQLTHQIDQAGYEVKLSYEADQLIKIESPSGYLELIYEGDCIGKITDHANRTISYEYENELLSTYINALGNSYSYEYDLRKRLVNITNPVGNLLVENIYDENDRITKQTYADNSEMLYSYCDFKKATTFIKQNGSEFVYKRDDQYRTTGIIEPDGEIKIEYNENSQRSKYIDKLGNKTFLEYNEVGNISKVTNALGVITELEYAEGSSKITSITIDGKQKIRNNYDDLGNLVSLQDALNNEITIAYKENNLPQVITQADGSQISLIYDGKGNIIQVEDASGVITKYHYDELNRIISTVDGNQNVTSFGYDDQGNIIEVKNAEGSIQTYTYNKTNKVIKINQPNGGKIKREYNNKLGKLSKVIDQLGRETIFEYDIMWNVSKVMEANGAETEFIYNEMNRLETIVKPDSSLIAYEYDPNGNRTKIIDEAGNETNLSYDALGQLVEITGAEGLKFSYTYNSEGQVISVTDAMKNVVNLEYDALGQLVKETNVLGDSRVYTYTSLGKIATVTDEAGRITTHEYGLGGRLKLLSHPDGTNERFAYDNNGNLKAYMNKIGQVSEYNYDSLNRVTSIYANRNTKIYTYDVMNNVISMTDELGNKTNYEYTPTGQLAKVIDALGNVAYYKYDERDQLIEVRQEGSEVFGIDDILEAINAQNKANQELRITKYHRNLMGQVELVEDVLGNKETYTYSPKGQLIEKMDKDGYLTKYGYSAHGDVTHVQYADGNEVKMSYNPLRQLTEIQDWLGVTQIEIDALGRATKVSNYNDQVVEYKYGRAGEREQIIYPDGKAVMYQYDDVLRLIKVRDGNQEINYQYDKFSRLISKQFGDNTRTEYGYNALGQLSELTHLNNGQILDSYKYSYDALSNKTQIEKVRQGMAADSGLFGYKYDALNRLSAVMKDGHPLRSYRYDSFGNRVLMVETGNETTYQFNNLNQLITSTDSEGLIQCYNYDKRGHLTEVYKGENIVNQYKFGALNRLESAFNHEKNLGATYAYNGLGHRVGKVEGKSLEPVSPTTRLDSIIFTPINQIDDVIDLTCEFHNLLERKTNDHGISYIFDFGMLSASSEGQNLNYLCDDRGSPVRLMHGTGVELDVLGFDEFGNSLTYHAPKTLNPFAFTGYLIDPIADIYLSPTRAYDAESGRFTSEDIVKGFIEAPFTLNAYTYCRNQPMDLVDFDGKSFRRIEIDGNRYGTSTGCFDMDIRKDILNNAVGQQMGVNFCFYDMHNLLQDDVAILGQLERDRQPRYHIGVLDKYEDDFLRLAAFHDAMDRNWLILDNDGGLSHLGLTEGNLMNGYLAAYFEWRPYRNLLYILASESGWITIDLNNILEFNDRSDECLE